MVGSRLDEYIYKFIFDPQAHFHNELNVEVTFKYDGNTMPTVTNAQLCTVAPETTAPATTDAGATTAPTTPAVTTPIPDHCEDILSLVEIKDKWQCRACSRARFYAQNVPRLTNDDTMTVTFDAEVEFRNINYPIKEIVNVGGFKYQLTFQDNAHLHNQLNVEVEFKYVGDTAPAVLQAQLCDPTPVTTAVVTTDPGATTAAPTTPAATTPVPDHCEDILSLVEIKDKWQCRACSRARFYAQNVPRLTNDDTMTVTFDAEVEFRNINYPIKEIVNVGGFKYQITFQDNAHLHNQLNVEIEFKYSGDNAPAVLQAQLCDPAPATTAVPTTGPATSPGETTPVPSTVATTPVPDHCLDILSIVEIKDNWQCRACSRARFYAQVGFASYERQI